MGSILRYETTIERELYRAISSWRSFKVASGGRGALSATGSGCLRMAMSSIDLIHHRYRIFTKQSHGDLKSLSLLPFREDYTVKSSRGELN